MLSKPERGWTNVTVDHRLLGDWTSVTVNHRLLGEASYITDVPIDTLYAFIKYFRKRRPINIFYDGEGYEFGIITFDDQLYSIFIDNDGSPSIEEINMTVEDLAMEVVEDIESNLRAWAEWGVLNKDDEEAIKNREMRLAVRCYHIRELCEHD